MPAIENLTKLPNTTQLGTQMVFVFPISIKVADDSFLHIGGTSSPLTEKKQPVFSVDGRPVIPASSFKGALRQQVENLLIQKRDRLAQLLGLTGSQTELLKPSIPAPRPSKAEQELFGRGYRKEPSEIKVEDDRVKVPINGLCPVSYFFGATGLEGYLYIPNFFPGPAEWRIDQTRIRIDRKSQTAAPGAIVTGEQVKPGSVFKGEIRILAERHGASFGRCRTIGGTKVDLWLDNWAESDDEKRALLLINEVLIPSLNNIALLGGQKSLGGGRITISYSAGSS
ncbi:MAG TPA: RAMP superfamily CRISPR-associated protein [Acidobacteriota bacterium]|jgi:CRISPR/Cas system CSM-associated protein Csm3 (group 7 of RAMP superfamily)